MSSNLFPVNQIIEGLQYYDSSDSFFGLFADAYDKVSCQVLKLETRQEYLEPGNPSFDLLSSGKFDEAVDILGEFLGEQDPIDRSLQSRGVDFIRCRPVLYPLTTYLKWEFETYKYSAKNLERIFCCSLDLTRPIFDQIATHDFMVFDSSVAFIHDYDEQGLIRGGWSTRDVEKIILLQSIFIYIKSFCSPFTTYLKDN
jgi:hypothetical protein